MEKIITYLESKRELTVSLVLTYFIFILSMHDFMVNLSVDLMNSITRDKYNLIVGVIMFTAMAFILILFVRNLKIVREATDIKIAYMLIMTGLVVIHTQMNFVVNIEIIHTLQFGILALLIFPLTRSFGATLYYTVLLGLVDELFQYAVLYPDKNDYLDFNDIILDQIGAGIILVYLYSAGVRSDRNKSVKWYKSSVLISILLIVGTITALLHFSLISLYFSSEAEKPLFLLNEGSGPEDFWRHLPNSNIVYHVMSPQEGAAILAIICGLFFFLDYLDRNKVPSRNTPNLESDNWLSQPAHEGRQRFA